MDELGKPISSSNEIDKIVDDANLGKVITRIIFKIPSYTRWYIYKNKLHQYTENNTEE